MLNLKLTSVQTTAFIPPSILKNKLDQNRFQIEIYAIDFISLMFYLRVNHTHITHNDIDNLYIEFCH